MLLLDLSHRERRGGGRRWCGEVEVGKERAE